MRLPGIDVKMAFLGPKAADRNGAYLRPMDHVASFRPRVTDIGPKSQTKAIPGGMHLDEHLWNALYLTSADIASKWMDLSNSDAAVLYSPVSVAEVWAGARTNEFDALSNLFLTLTGTPIDAEPVVRRAPVCACIVRFRTEAVRMAQLPTPPTFPTPATAACATSRRRSRPVRRFC